MVSLIHRIKRVRTRKNRVKQWLPGLWGGGTVEMLLKGTNLQLVDH